MNDRIIKAVNVDLDVVNRNLERCGKCKNLPRWSAFGPTVGYELGCACYSTTSLRSISLAVKSWRKWSEKMRSWP